MTQTITMRIWTLMGKENIRTVSDFRVHNGELLIQSDNIEDTHQIIEAGQPCNISFITCESEDEVGQYREHSYRDCSLVRGRIVFGALCVPA